MYEEATFYSVHIQDGYRAENKPGGGGLHGYSPTDSVLLAAH